MVDELGAYCLAKVAAAERSETCRQPPPSPRKTPVVWETGRRGESCDAVCQGGREGGQCEPQLFPLGNDCALMLGRFDCDDCTPGLVLGNDLRTELCHTAPNRLLECTTGHPDLAPLCPCVYL